MPEKLGGEVHAWGPTLTGDDSDWVAGLDATRTAGVSIVDDVGSGGTQAWDVPGGNEDVRVPDAPSLTFGDVTSDRPFSGSIWVKPTSNERGRLFAKSIGPTAGEYELSCFFGALYIAIIDHWSGARIGRSANGVYVAGVWQHIAWTYDGDGDASGIKLYHNGVRVDHLDYNHGVFTAMEPSGYDLTIGGTNNQSDQHAGLYDDARIFEVELTAKDIETLSTRRGRIQAHETLGGELNAWSPTITGDATDWVGGNDGLLSGVVITNNRGAGGRKAFTHDGANGFVNCGALSSPSQFSVSQWVRPRLAFGLHAPATGYTTDNDSLFQSFQNADAFHFRVYDAAAGANYIGRSTSPIFRDDEWVQLTATYDGGSAASAIRIYANGVRVDVADDNDGVFSAAYDQDFTLRIGAQSFGVIHWDGETDDVRFFGRVLLESEARELYRRGYMRGVAGPAREPVLWINPDHDRVAVYSGQNAHDFSGSGSPGSLENGAVYVADNFDSGKWAIRLASNQARVRVPGVFPLSGCSVSMWVFATVGGDDHGGMTHRHDADNHLTISFRTNLTPGYINVSVTIAGVQYARRTGWNDVTQDEWHHVTVTIADNVQTDSDIEIWVDGVKLDQATGGGISSLGDFGEVWFGARHSTHTPNEIQADMRYYDRVLSVDEIKHFAGKRSQVAPAYFSDCQLAIDPTRDLFGAQTVDTAIDLTLLGGSGALKGGTVYAADTEFDGVTALDFGAHNNGAHVTTTVARDLTPEMELTVAFWIRKTVDDEWQIICQHYDGVADNGWRIGIRGSDNLLIFSLAGVLDYGMPAVVPQVNTWHHIAVTLSGTDLHGWIDGVKSPRYGVGDSPIGNRTTFLIGEGAPGLGMSGRLDGLQVYSRRLSDVEIIELYQAGRAGRLLGYNQLFGFGTNNEDTAIEGHWLLDEQAGDVIADSSAWRRDGDYVGTLATAPGPTGYLASAIDFDGATNFVNLDAADVRLVSLDTWGAMARLQADLSVAGVAVNKCVFAFGGTASSFQTQLLPYYEKLTPTVIHARIRQNGTYANIGTAAGTISGNWINHAWSKQFGSNIAIFEDDEYLGNFGSDVRTRENTNRTRIGQEPTTQSEYFTGRISDFVVFSRELTAVDDHAYNAGPTAIYVGDDDPDFAAPPTVGTPVTVTTQLTDWELPEPFTGSNGVVQRAFTWIIADDANGSGAQAVAATLAPETYTPTAEDLGKFLRFEERSINAGGVDFSEAWSSDYAEVTDDGPPPPVLDAETGVFALTGFDVAFSRSLALQAETGVFALTGFDATLTHVLGNTLLAQVGRFDLTGFDARLIATHNPLQAETGVFVLTGFDAVITPGLILKAETGVFALTGNDAGLTADLILRADTGAFVLTGWAARLIYSEAGLTAGFVCIRDGRLSAPYSKGAIKCKGSRHVGI